MSTEDPRAPQPHHAAPPPQPGQPVPPPPPTSPRGAAPHAPAQPAPASAAPQQPEPGAPRRRKRRAGRIVAHAVGWTFLGAGILTLGGLSAYLWSTHQEWVDQNEQLRVEAESLGERLAVAEAEAEAADAQQADTAAQLEEAKATISTLADQDANATDELTYVEDLVQQVLVCADERAELIGYLKESQLYTASSLREAESSIDEFCDGLADSWAEYEANQ